MPRARAANPRKNRNWTIEINGLEQFFVQKCTIPTAEIEKAEHADSNHSIKTGTNLKYEDIVLEKLMFAEGGDLFAWNWVKEVQDPATGGGGLPSAYKKDLIIKHYAPDGITVLDQWDCFGCFACKVEYPENDRMSNENMMETVTISIDYYDRQVTA